jgi:uncharacterized delta-60 repeat protein
MYRDLYIKAKAVSITSVQEIDSHYVGGQFPGQGPGAGQIGDSPRQLANLNTDGTPNVLFNIARGFSGNISTLTIQTDGKVIVGGSFNSYQGITTNSIIRLNSDGTRDTSFNISTGFNGNISTLVIQSDGKILVGGSFTSYRGVAANRIIRLNNDGTRDTSFDIGTGFNSTVSALTIQTDGKVIVGGSFTSYQGVAANRIIRLNSDGTRDTSFDIGTGFDNGVDALAIQSDGKILVGGRFTAYQGVAANRIIRLNSDGIRDTSFDIGTGFTDTVNVVTIRSDGKILVGGRLASYQGVAGWGLIQLNSDGSIDAAFNVGEGFGGGQSVNTIVLQSDGKVLIGGNIITYQQRSVGYILRLNSDGSIDGAFDVGTGFNNIVNTLAIQSDGKIFVGGTFTRYKARTPEKTNIIGYLKNGIPMFNLIGMESFNNFVFTILIQTDGKLLIGGRFKRYTDSLCNGIVRLNNDGSIDDAFDIGNGFTSTSTDTQVNTLAIQSDGKIIAGGDFTAYRGVAANRIIRLNSNGTRDTSFDIGTGFSGNINTLVIQSDGKIIVGGSFTSYQGVAANRIIRLNSDGTRDTSFDIGTGFESTVSTLVIQSDGKILAGGDFTTYRGVAANRIIRLNSDGIRDTSFEIGTGFNSSLSSLAIQSDGKILVGGRFTAYQGVAANRIIRLNSDGTRDTSFDIGTGFVGGGVTEIRAISLQSDGKSLVGGSFTTYNDISATGIIRLNSDGTKDITYKAFVETGVYSIAITK